MKKKILAVLLATGVAATTVLGGSILVSAADDGGNTAQARTLDEIKKDGKIKIGVFSDKNPFGYVDENGDVQGYDIYFGKRLAKDLHIWKCEVYFLRSVIGYCKVCKDHIYFCRLQIFYTTCCLYISKFCIVFKSRCDP